MKENTTGQEHYEGEIDLADLIMPIIKRKLMIFFAVLVAVLIAFFYCSITTPLYRSEAIIESSEPNDSSLSSLLQGDFSGKALSKTQLVLESRALNVAIIEKYGLLPNLFKEKWDAINKRWDTKEPPTLDDGYLKIKKMLEVTKNKNQNLLVVAFKAPDPVQTMEMLTIYFDELGEFLRQQELIELSAQIKTLGEQMGTASDPLLRIKLSEIIAKYIDRQAFIMSQKYYGFRVLAPPYVPEKPFSPNMKKILAATIFGTFFIMVLIAYIVEFMAEFKNKNEQKFIELQQFLSVRNDIKTIITFITNLFKKK